MDFSVLLSIVVLFHCLTVIGSAPMPFGKHRSRHYARCTKYGRRCKRDKNCWCKNEVLSCKFVFLKGRKECVKANKYALAMFDTTSSPTNPEMCYKYQHQCYHDNDCECEYGEYLYCRQSSVDTKGLCLTQHEDLPSWFTHSSPTYKPPTTNSSNPNTPTSPATTKWQCETRGTRCEEDTDCLCEHSSELSCVYSPEMQHRSCQSEKQDPTNKPPISSRGTQSPPISEQCPMFAKNCSSNTDCFCEQADDLSCVYVHEEKGHFCLTDDWAQGEPPTNEHPPSTAKPPPPTTKPRPISTTGSHTIATKPPTKEDSKTKNTHPWNPTKFGTSTLDGGRRIVGNQILPITKSPWNIWGTKTSSIGKKKEDHITLIASKKLALSIPVESLKEVIHEIHDKKLIK